ncbi:hypothetical protein B484DRAFT_455142 [Ochromonadaceae sp. CCMP2298]|nr:hypothetical protein B484DRAFT_455142 [Ochromonadaceae sp. CCMP2298]
MDNRAAGRRLRAQKRAELCIKMCRILYRGVQGGSLAIQYRREHGQDPALTFGEIVPQSFLQILAFVSAPTGTGAGDTGPRTFVDLGSGSGRACICAALSPYGFTSVLGVELMPTLCAQSEGVLGDLIQALDTDSSIAAPTSSTPVSSASSTPPARARARAPASAPPASPATKSTAKTAAKKPTTKKATNGAMDVGLDELAVKILSACASALDEGADGAANGSAVSGGSAGGLAADLLATRLSGLLGHRQFRALLKPHKSFLRRLRSQPLLFCISEDGKWVSLAGAGTGVGDGAEAGVGVGAGAEVQEEAVGLGIEEVDGPSAEAVVQAAETATEVEAMAEEEVEEEAEAEAQEADASNNANAAPSPRPSPSLILSLQDSQLLSPLPHISFLCADIFHTDWSAADVVYIASLLFSEEMMQRLTLQCLNLRPGCWVISLKPLGSHPLLVLRSESFYKMSWQMARVFIYQVCSP